MERLYRFGTLCGVFCALVLAPRSVYSAPSFNAPNSFSYEGILKDSAGNPITSSTVKLRLYVLPDAASGSSCVLLRDEHSLDLSASNGYFSVGIGSSPKSGSATVDGDPGNQLAKVFQNRYKSLAITERQPVTTLRRPNTIEGFKFMSAQTVARHGRLSRTITTSILFRQHKWLIVCRAIICLILHWRSQRQL